jgi:multimeric flavodoxin WrbA
MKALVLNGAEDVNTEIIQIHDLIISLLGEYHFRVDNITLRDKRIAPCQGCFDCWVKTPGVCRIDDYGRTIAEKTVQSSLVIHLTPITFGGYSSELKKVIDRSIPIILPFFRKFKGEIHHKQRYEERASLIVIGYQKTSIKVHEETFRELVDRNALNMVPPIYKTIIFTENQEISSFQAEIVNILEEVNAYYE